MSSPALQLDAVACAFVDRADPGQRYTAVHDVTLTVGAGEFVSVVGPTGCGKSTLLNVAAGLLAPSTGRIDVFGQPLAGINARAGYMFQGESLMPWRTALENVRAGLEFRNVALPDATAQAEEWLRRVGLGGFGDRAVYIDAFLASKGALSPDGMIPEAGAATALRALQSVDDSLRDVKFDLPAVYTNDFVKKANARSAKG